MYTSKIWVDNVVERETAKNRFWLYDWYKQTVKWNSMLQPRVFLFLSSASISIALVSASWAQANRLHSTSNSVPLVQTGVISSKSTYNKEPIVKQLAKSAHLRFSQAQTLLNIAHLYQTDIIVRPVTPLAPTLRSQSFPPKPSFVKYKTCSILDIDLGAPKQDCIGRVILFDPALPSQQRCSLSHDSTSLINPLCARYWYRKQEWTLAHDTHLKGISEITHLSNLGLVWLRPNYGGVRFTIPGGFILEPQSGRPFTGDLDLFEIVAHQSHTQHLKSALKTTVVRALRAHPDVDVMHGAHMDWVTASKKEHDLKQRIIGIHRQGGEALIKIKSNHEICFTWAPPIGVEAATYSYPCH